MYWPGDSTNNQSREAWLVVGRRGGKSFALALIAVFLAAFHKWQDRLGPGERGIVMVIAADRRQARVILRYVKGLVHEPDAIGTRRGRAAGKLQTSITGSVSRSIPPPSERSVDTPSSRHCSTRLPSGKRTKHRPSRIPRLSPRYDPQWRQCPAVFSWPRPARTHDAVPCGKPSVNIIARMVIPFLFGRLTPGR